MATFDLEILPWDPICGKFGKVWERGNVKPLTEAEANELLAMLSPCVDDYRGQGQTLHGIRKVKRV